MDYGCEEENNNLFAFMNPSRGFSDGEFLVIVVIAYKLGIHVLVL